MKPSLRKTRPAGSVPATSTSSPPAKHRAAIYLRVSTDEQTNENQRPDVLRLLQARSYELVTVYEEQVSGAARARPRFDAMMRDAHRGGFDVLVVWALDRFGRSFSGNIQAIKQLDEQGVCVVSVRETWLDTTSGLARKILLGVVCAIAEDERDRISERTRAGMDRAKRAGKHVGRPRARIDVVRARALHEDEGLTWDDVARRLGVSPATLFVALKRGTEKSTP